MKEQQSVLAVFDADPDPVHGANVGLLRSLEHCAQSGRRVLLQGASGSGRSTLLRNWLAERIGDGGIAFAFAFAGTGTRHERTSVGFLHRLCERIAVALGEPVAVPVDGPGLREALPGWLARASSRGRALIVLDDLDYLDGENLTDELAWLPDYLPPDVTLVASAAPGAVPRVLKGAGWHVLTMEDSPDRLAQSLAEDGETESPEEALVARAVGDVDVQRLLMRLWAAPEGLPATWLTDADAVLDSLRPFLRTQGEQITLRHERLREAVAYRWLADKESRRRVFRTLADLETEPLRQAWRLASAEDWPALLARLASVELLAQLDDERYALTNLWRALPARDAAASHLHQVLIDLGQADDGESMLLARSYEAGARILEELDAAEVVTPLLRAARRRLGSATGGQEREVMALLDHWLGVQLAADGDEAAVQALGEALAARKQLLGADAPATRASRHALAIWHEDQGDLAAAETLYRETLAARENTVGTKHEALIPHLGNLAGVLRADNRLELARPLLERVLRLSVNGPGRNHPAYAAALDNLGGLLYAGHDYAGAVDRYREALTVTERLFGPGHPATAACAHNLGTTFDALERYREAERLYRHALAIRHAAYGEEHAETATSLHNLAGVLDVLGGRDEAEALYRRAVAVWTAVAGECHPATATSLNNLADLLREARRYDEAEPLYRANLSTWRTLLGDTHPNTLMTVAELGGLYADIGHPDAAESLLREAVVELERVMGTDNLLHVESACRLARVLRETGRAREAVDLLAARYERGRASIAVLSPRMRKLHRHLELARAAAASGSGTS